MARNWNMLPILVLALKGTGKLASPVRYGMLCPGHTAGGYFWDTIPNVEEWSHHKASAGGPEPGFTWAGSTGLSHIISGTVTVQEFTPLAPRQCWQVDTSNKGWKTVLHRDRDTQRAQFCLLLCWRAEVPVKPTVDILLLSPEPGAWWDLHRRARHHKAFRHPWRRAAELAVVLLKIIWFLLFARVYVCLVHRCTWVFLSVWERLRVQVRTLACGRSMCGRSGLMLSFSPLFFHLIHRGKGSLSDPELTDRASFPRQLALGSLCFDFLRLELTGNSVHPQQLCGSCRSELFFCLYGKCF